MSSPSAEFLHHLSKRNHLSKASRDLGDVASATPLRTLWEMTELSANDFADEVAQFYRLKRLSLPELIAATPLTAQFSHRFLREMTIFPHRTEQGAMRLAVADPTDAASVRASEIVLGAPL